MTVGRYVQRGRVFQGRASAGRALANAGGAPVVQSPNDGWTATSRGRVSIAASRDRVWIAKGKN